MFGADGTGQDAIQRSLARLHVRWDGAKMAIDRCVNPPFLLRGRRPAFGPTIGKNIVLPDLPHAHAEVGLELNFCRTGATVSSNSLSRLWACLPAGYRRQGGPSSLRAQGLKFRPSGNDAMTQTPKVSGIGWRP